MLGVVRPIKNSKCNYSFHQPDLFVVAAELFDKLGRVGEDFECGVGATHVLHGFSDDLLMLLRVTDVVRLIDAAFIA